MRERAERRGLLDLAIYVGVGLALAGFAVWYGVHSARTGASGQLPLRWIGLAGATAVTFWYPVRRYRRYWGHLSFWLKVVALLAVHLLGYTVLLLRIPEWRLLWFVPPSVVEGGVLVLVLNKLVGRSP